MKLTNTARDAFVASVLDDVPQVDYAEQYRMEIQRWAIAQLPPKLALLYKTHSAWFNHTTIIPHDYTISGVHVVYEDGSGRTKLEARLKEQTNINAIYAAHKAQLNARAALRDKVKGAIYACSTLKQARDLMPEFAKYLPDEIPPDRSVPAIANLVADLTAAGWPKDAAMAEEGK